jgi:hypothetical protein
MIGAEYLECFFPPAINATINLFVDKLFRRYATLFCSCFHPREPDWGEPRVFNRSPQFFVFHRIPKSLFVTVSHGGLAPSRTL